MAIEEIKMPQLGESVTEGTIEKWLVSVGDTVNKYDPLAEVITDKVGAEIPSSFTGKIVQLTAAEGETIAVGECICTIETEEGNLVAANSLTESEQKITPTNASISESKKLRYSPAVLKLSQEHSIDLAQVKGTGAEGRITRKDVLKMLETGKPQMQAKEVEAIQPAAIEAEDKAISTSAWGDIEIPVSPVRKAIAANMLKSKHEIPHAWMMIEVDVTDLVSYRESEKAAFQQKEGFSLTYFAFFVKAIAQALKEYPQMNAMWAGDKIIQKKEINLSIAVATDDALFVPVIKNTDEKTIKGIAREISQLARKVREGKLTLQDTQGGTFTINNTGTFGSIQSMGIINHPQAAILQVEAIVKRPMIVNGGIMIRDMVNLCLSLDHRVLDGLICGKFMKRVKEILESTSKNNTSLY